MNAPIVQIATGPDVFLLPVDDGQGKGIFTNCYLVRDGSESLVVDTGGFARDGRALWDDAFARVGVDRQKTAFFLTHAHVDHAGLLESVAPEGAVVYAGGPDLDLVRELARGATTQALVERLRAEGASGQELEEYASFECGITPFDQDRFDVRRLEAGDVVTVGSVAFEVVDTSGHSPGHRSLYHACSKTMFCGDHVLFSSSPYIPWYPGVPDSFGRYLDSLEHVARWDVAMPLPAHGDVRPRADFAERARWLHEHKSAKVASLLQLIAACPGRTGLELVRALYRIGGAERWEAMSFVSRWCLLANGVSMLDHLVSCGRVEVEVGPDGARRYCAANRGSLQPSGINAAVMPRRR